MKNLTYIHTILAAVFITCAAYSLIIGNENTSAIRAFKFKKESKESFSSKKLHVLAAKKQGVDFVKECDKVAASLGVPTEWLLAVINHESKFSHTVANYAGSKAVGLIQFMPPTARDLGTSTNHLASITAVQQLRYVKRYLMREKRNGGGFYSCGDLYLAVFYPKYRKYVKAGQFDTVIAKYPKKAYMQNSGMDINKDNKLTVGDICTLFYKKNKSIYR